MFKRSFWLGLLLGGSAAAGLFLRRSAPASSQNPLLDLLNFTSDAFVVCDAAGAIISSNAAARQLFGPACAGLSFLCYPNGQRVPPSQLPHVRALRSGQNVPRTEYRFTSVSGSVSILHATASALPDGKAAAALEDVTVLYAAQARLGEAQAWQAALDTLGRRLGAAAAAGALGRVIVEETHALLAGLPDVQVRLYGYSAATQVLTRLASEPEDRPKRPKTLAEAQSPHFPFDAGAPALWQIYVARQPVRACPAMLGEAEAASAYALPLLAGGVALGHLSLSSSAADAFDDPGLRQTLRIAASAAALALSAPQAADLAGVWAAQTDALREVTEAIAQGEASGPLADLVSLQVRRVINAAVCTVSVEAGGKMCLLGEAFRNDLLHPERSHPGDPALQSKAARKAWRTQKTVTQLGLANPGVEKGAWRAFAGRAGQHSVLALPLASRLGVVAVCWEGARLLPEMQRNFLETVAALAAIGLKPATIGEAAED